MSYINQDFFEKLQNLYLRNSYTSQLVAGISGSYTYNNQLKNPGRNATLVRFNWETAGNLIGGLEHLFSSPAKGKDYYEIFGIQYSQYFRVDLSASRKIMRAVRRTTSISRCSMSRSMSYWSAYGGSRVDPDS